MPAPGDFGVSIAGATSAPATVGVDGDTVTLTLATPARPTQTVTVTYTPGTHPIRDLAANPAVALDGHPVTNETVVLPVVSIAAVHPTAAPVIALPELRVSVSEVQSADLEVTLAFTQDAAYVSEPTRTVTIATGDRSETVKLALSTDTGLASGDLTATVTGGGRVYAPAAAPDNAATVAVKTDAPPITAAWAEDAYRVEEGDRVTVSVALATVAGVPRPREPYAVAVATAPGTATAGTDFTALDEVLTVARGDWTSAVATTTVYATVTLPVETLEDTVLEGDETLHVRLSEASGHPAPGFSSCPAALQDLGATTSCSTEVTIDDDETLSVTGVAVTSTPASGDTYLAAEVIEFTVGFTAAVTADTTGGTPALAFTLGAEEKTATYASATSTTLAFTYTVAAGDLDEDGISWDANAIALDGGTIRLTTTVPDLVVDADLAHDAAPAQPRHKVDAKVPVLASATYLGEEVELIYDEPLDASSVPAASAYTLLVGSGTAPSVDGVSIAGNTVTLALSAEPPEGVTLTYEVPASNPVQDLAGNDAEAFSEHPLTPGERLRLVGGTGDHEGRLEVRYRGEWGTICDDYWTDVEADLSCRLLGYPEGSTGNSGRFTGAHFGEGTGKIWLDNLTCLGDETRLLDCPRAPNKRTEGPPGLGVHNCTHREDVGVQCEVPGTQTGPGTPVVSGEAQVGKALRADRGTIRDAHGLPQGTFPDGYTFRWIRVDGSTDTDISGATSRTYTLVAADAGKRVKVRVSFTDAEGNDETRTSTAWPAAGVVAAADDPPAGDEALPAFSVADAETREGFRARLDFEVTLDRAAAALVGVYYRTVDGTARAGPPAYPYVEGRDASLDCAKGEYTGDYMPQADLLVFPKGVTTRTVSVPVCDDAHDEGAETMTFELVGEPPLLQIERDEDGNRVLDDGLPRWARARIADRVATGTITNDDHMPRVWLARFGRTVGTQVLDALGERFTTSGGGSQVTVGGIALTAEGRVPDEARTDPFALPQWATGTREAEARTLTMEELVLGSAFRLRAGAEDATGARGGHGPAYTAWGRVARGGFSAEVDEEGQERLALDGEVTTGLVGVDAEWERLVAGVLVSQSAGEGTYRFTQDTGPGGGNGVGTVRSTLTGVYPYARVDLDARVSAWGVAGAGSGELRLRPPGEEALETGLALRLGALGVEGRVLDAAEPGDLAIDVRSDALWVRTHSDAVTDTRGGEPRASAGRRHPAAAAAARRAGVRVRRRRHVHAERRAGAAP